MMLLLFLAKNMKPCSETKRFIPVARPTLSEKSVEKARGEMI